jgi:hypothetical protein
VSNTTDAARTLATQCGAVFGRRLSVDLRFGAELVVTPHRRHPPRAHLDQSQGLDPCSRIGARPTHRHQYLPPTPDTPRTGHLSMVKRSLITASRILERSLPPPGRFALGRLAE